jgi:HSP20 family protein
MDGHFPANAPVGRRAVVEKEASEMHSNRWSLFADLSELNHELMNRLYSGGGTSRTATWAPSVESFYQGNNLMVRAWVPGVDPTTVDIKVSGNLLSIKGERKFTYDVRENQYLFTEVAYGPFERTITLPDGLAFDQVKAKYTHGVLDITLPIHEGVLPKKIPIEIEQSPQPILAGTR